MLTPPSTNASPTHEWVTGAPEYSGSSPIDTDSADSCTSFAHFSPAASVFTQGSLDAAVAELEELEDPYLNNRYCVQPSAMKREVCAPSRRVIPKEEVGFRDSDLGAASGDADAEQASDEDEEMEQSTQVSSSEPDEDDQPDEDQSRDRLLLDLRDRGVPYKDIKRLGRFTEAESTLRGRVRMLTKQKHERVRRPQWTTQDVRRALFPHSC